MLCCERHFVVLLCCVSLCLLLCAVLWLFNCAVVVQSTCVSLCILLSAVLWLFNCAVVVQSTCVSLCILLCAVPVVVQSTCHNVEVCTDVVNGTMRRRRSLACSRLESTTLGRIFSSNSASAFSTSNEDSTGMVCGAMSACTPSAIVGK